MGAPAWGGERFFYVAMAALIAVIVACGFSYTVGANLLHPPYPRPWILYAHAAIATAWVPLLLVQTVLVRSHRVDLHRRLGLWGVFHGALIPTFGLATAMAMAKVRLAHGDADAAVSFPIPVNDALAFTVAFSLGVYRRNRPDFHRRLMFMASAILTAAAFGRMPVLDHAEWFYAGVDALILLGLLRDLAATRRIHPTYRYGLPLILLGQLLTAYVRWTPRWLAFAPRWFA